MKPYGYYQNKGIREKVKITENLELPTIRYSDLRYSAARHTKELLQKEGKVVVTADGRPTYICMSIENYVASLPVNQHPPRQPKMVRLEGVLYREVI